MDKSKGNTSLLDSGSQPLFVQMVLKTWQAHLKRADTAFGAFTHEQFLSEIAPGRNRIVYLLGHVTAVHDGMFPLFGLGDKLYPQLERIFITQPDRAVAELPSVDELKKYWADVNAKLTGHFNEMSPQQWFEKHTAVSEEDFAKDPSRNKLNVLLSRTSHLAYHGGQLALQKK